MQAFVGTYAAANDDSAKKAAFNVDNPTLTMAQTSKRGQWHSATLGTGTISFLALLVITITALPALRRRDYNIFYYAHVILSSIIFISASIHASTDFYFLLPGLLLWVGDWGWRFFSGETGLRKTVNGTLENAGYGWYRITLPVSAKTLKLDQPGDDEVLTEKQLPVHPIQSYYLNIPSISKLQSHAFTAAKVGSSNSGPVFLFQRTQGTGKTKQKKLDKEWTWKVGSQANDLDAVDLEEKKAFEVRVEGPYVPTETGYQTADRIVCVVGGTGLTGAYSLALWWLESRTRDSGAHFTLIWTVRHRETARLEEWQELEERARRAGNMTVKIHVSSEEGRLDAMKLLTEEFTASGGREKRLSEKAWIYVSGPAGLLSKVEDACVDVERGLKLAEKTKSESGFTITEMDHYVARWEV